ncbi:MAG: gliding motility protein GldC [Flavobacteriales bacterium]|nr:gliding motility protein GldC [Flavobacteriales bacterium]
MSKQADINIKINLDENHIPEEITWSATDGGIQEEKTPAVLISVWDEKKMETLRLDLWTKEMQVDHMKRFFHQIFVSLGNTYQRATGEDDVAQTIQEFAEEFANQSGIKM